MNYVFKYPALQKFMENEFEIIGQDKSKVNYILKSKDENKSNMFFPVSLFDIFFKNNNDDNNTKTVSEEEYSKDRFCKGGNCGN